MCLGIHTLCRPDDSESLSNGALLIHFTYSSRASTCWCSCMGATQGQRECLMKSVEGECDSDTSEVDLIPWFGTWGSEESVMVLSGGGERDEKHKGKTIVKVFLLLRTDNDGRWVSLTAFSTVQLWNGVVWQRFSVDCIVWTISLFWKRFKCWGKRWIQGKPKENLTQIQI